MTIGSAVRTAVFQSSVLLITEFAIQFVYDSYVGLTRTNHRWLRALHSV